MKKGTCKVEMSREKKMSKPRQHRSLLQLALNEVKKDSARNNRKDFGEDHTKSPEDVAPTGLKCKGNDYAQNASEQSAKGHASKSDFLSSMRKEIKETSKNQCEERQPSQTADNSLNSRRLRSEVSNKAVRRNSEDYKSELYQPCPKSDIKQDVSKNYQKANTSQVYSNQRDRNSNKFFPPNDHTIQRYNSVNNESENNRSTPLKSNYSSTAKKLSFKHERNNSGRTLNLNVSSRQDVWTCNDNLNGSEKCKGQKVDQDKGLLYSDFEKKTFKDCEIIAVKEKNNHICSISESKNRKGLSITFSTQNPTRSISYDGSSDENNLDDEFEDEAALGNKDSKKNLVSFEKEKECLVNVSESDTTQRTLDETPLKRSVVVPHVLTRNLKTNENDQKAVFKNNTSCVSNIKKEKTQTTIDAKNPADEIPEEPFQLSHDKTDKRDTKKYEYIDPVYNPIPKTENIQSTIKRAIYKDDQNKYFQLNSVPEFNCTTPIEMKMLSNGKNSPSVSKSPETEIGSCQNITAEQYEAITKYILEIEKERKIDCKVAERVCRDLKRFFCCYFPGTFIKYYGSYYSGIAISTSNINISLRVDGMVRNCFLHEVHKGLSNELPNYHLLPYEEKSTLKATKIVFAEPYTGVECEMVYLGKSQKNVVDMAMLLKMFSEYDLRVKSLFIAARIWAEVCAIDEVEDGKLPAVAFPLLVIYFLQQHKKRVLPVLKIEEFWKMEEKLMSCPKTNSTVGELWFDFLLFYAETFNWNENIVSITDLEPVPKSSKFVDKVWMYIEDPITKRNVAESVTNLDTANLIQSCFVAFYHHLPSLNENDSSSETGAEKWIYSFDSCNIYQYAPQICEDCNDIGTATCRACMQKEYIPMIESLPDLPENSPFLKIVDKVLIDLYNEYILTESAIKGRKAFVDDLEKYIQQRFRGAKLALFGSSVNGFGFNKSDLDINLTFSTNEIKERCQQISILKQVMRHMRKNGNYKDVFFLPAQIPIVKFCFVQNGWCGDISFGNTLAICNSDLLHAYSTIDERCRILGCALKLVTKKTRVASTVDKALSSYSYIIMVIYYLQQIQPPVLPILQDYKICARSLEVPIEIVENWNTWFAKGDKEAYAVILSEQSDQPKNAKTVGQLWIGLLDFYANFNYDHVISICQRELVFVEEKQKTFSYNIQDPFILSKNLGSVLSSGKAKEIQNVLCHARQLFRNQKRCPKKVDSYKNYFFSATNLTGRTQKEMECRQCGGFDHETDKCQHLNRLQFRINNTFDKY